MSVLSSYVALGDCSLCILKGEGSMERSRSSHRGRGRSKDGHEYLRKGGLVTVLSVKELSTPVRAVYDSGEQFLVDKTVPRLAFLLSPLCIILNYSKFISHYMLFIIHNRIQAQTIAIPHQPSPLISDAQRAM